MGCMGCTAFREQAHELAHLVGYLPTELAFCAGSSEYSYGLVPPACLFRSWVSCRFPAIFTPNLPIQLVRSSVLIQRHTRTTLSPDCR